MTEDLGRTLERHIIGLRRYAVSLLRDSIEADDLVQECMVRALSRAHVWPRVQDRRAYLFTILHNIYVDRRTQYRRHEHHIPIDDVAKELYSLPNQNERLEIRDFKRALNDLPENYRVVTLLVGLEGMTYRQAAEVLGVPVGTVMSRLSRGREFLRRHMNGDDDRPAKSDPKGDDDTRHAGGDAPPTRNDGAEENSDDGRKGNGNGDHRPSKQSKGNGSARRDVRDADEGAAGRNPNGDVGAESMTAITKFPEAEAGAK